MSEDERLAWARLVSGRAVESHRLWSRYYDAPPSSLTDEERSDGALQCSLVRVLWRGTAPVALSVIGYLGDTFTAASPVAAVDALGLVMCHVAALAEISELTMSAVIELALQRIIDGEVPVIPSSDLARSLGRGGVDFSASTRSAARNCARLDALAGVVARAMDDVHINHGVEVKPMDLYRRIADEVIAGRMPVQPERDPLELRYSLERQPEPQRRPALSYEERERALDKLVRMTQEMGGYPELDDPVPGLADQRICPQCAGLLSERGDGMLVCPSQHEFTAQQLQAIAAASTATEPTG